MHGQTVPRKRKLRFSAWPVSGAVALAALWICASITHPQAAAQETAAQRGRKQFAQSCGFCHGPDATGARGPDLVRSPLVAHDQKGELIGEVIRSGRIDKGMPAQQLTDEQIADIAAFLHARALEALHSSGVPSDYPAEKLLTGNAADGKAFFEGAGGCKNCHSATGDLAGVSAKYSATELEAHMLYPGDKKRTAEITVPSGEKIRGEVVHADDFMIGVRDADGAYWSFSRGKVQAEVHDPLEAHRKLLDQLTQKNVHDLYAYVHSL